MLKAELRKLITTRTTAALWAGALLVAIIGAYSTISSEAVDELTGPLRDQPLFILTAINLSVFALLVGVRSITDEFRYGTIGWTLVSVGHRWTVVPAKMVTAALAAALIAATAQVVAGGLALWVSSSRGGALLLTAADVRAAVALTAASGLWAMLGVGVGTLIRHQVAAVVAVLVWVLVAENLGAIVLGGLSDVLPGQAGLAMAGAVDRAGESLNPVAGAAVLVAYVAAVSLASVVSLDRRPVPAPA